jgi:hypothetical protein
MHRKDPRAQENRKQAKEKEEKPRYMTQIITPTPRTGDTIQGQADKQTENEE